MYSFSYLEPVCCSMSSSNSCFLTCIQISQEAGKVIWYSQSLEEFSTVYCDPHSQMLGIVNKAKIDVFLEFSCIFDDSVDVDNLISGSSAFSKTIVNIAFADNIKYNLVHIPVSNISSQEVNIFV